MEGRLLRNIERKSSDGLTVPWWSEPATRCRVQLLIGMAGEAITYKRVTHGSYITATLQSSLSVQSYAIKAGVGQYRPRDQHLSRPA